MILLTERQTNECTDEKQIINFVLLCSIVPGFNNLASSLFELVKLQNFPADKCVRSTKYKTKVQQQTWESIN